jgi:Fe-S-cluster containining protein
MSDQKKELDRLIPSLCTRCGKCCLNEDYMGTLEASRADVGRWRRQKRHDILWYVLSISDRQHDLWIKPDGTECSRCPFVRKDRNKPTHSCRIYDTRPEICREYPGSYAQMKDIGCEIIDELEKLGIDAEGWEACD